MAKKTVTIYDVANEAGVSMATVSRVVNGNKNVKKETSEKVQAVIDRLNYRPNQVARGLASNKTTTIGVMIPNVTDFYYSTLALGIDDIASMYEYNIILENSRKDSESEASVLNSLLSKQVDGVIYMGMTFSDEIRRQFLSNQTPAVLAGTMDPQADFASVNIDYRQATRQVTSDLLQRHDKVGLIVGDLDFPIDGVERLQGYKEALDQAHIDFDPALVFEVADNYDQAYDKTDDILSQSIGGVVVTSDEVAVGIMNRSTELGKKIPQDIEIFTSHNTKISRMVRPTLSTIEEPTYDVGAVAMRLLTKLMNEEDIQDRQVILPHDIVHRETTIDQS